MGARTSEGGISSAATVYELGPFRLDSQTGVLTRLGMPEPLGERAVAVLRVLVANAGRPITKEAILNAAWPNRIVEESNLSVQVAAIRRVLGQVSGAERWVETIARRGYRFIGPATALRDGLPQHARSPLNLPAALTTFVGRQRELVELKRLLAKNRLLTLAGAGGIGKTRLALQLAAEACDAYRDGVWFIDFARLDDPGLVANAAAQALDVQQAAGRPLVDALCRRVRGKRLLLIFDNCEHVLDASSQLAEAMLRAGPDSTIIATSREPLRIDGEQIYRLSTLSVPDPAASAELIGQSEAVLLFVDRALLQQHDFALTTVAAPLVAQVCVRLDGIPFAIELAAALMDAHSIEDINAGLDDRFRLLTEGNRTALPRQKTLRATLDWSHELLSQGERALLRRISIFSGSFSVRAAEAITADATIHESAIHGLLTRLSTRSLLALDQDGRHRLLETTRAYACEKLDDAGETATIRRRHAHYMRDLFTHTVDDWMRLPESDWRTRYLPDVDNVRSALEWSLGTAGDAACAVALAGTSGPLWTSLSLYGEGIQRLEAASAQVDSKTCVSDEARCSLWLGSLLEPSDPIRAVTAFSHSIDLYLRAEEPLELTLARVWLARVLANIGQYESAAAALKASSPAVARLAVTKLQGIHSHNSGFLKLMTGDIKGARLDYENALASFRDAGSEFGVLASVSSVANVCWASGDLPAAATAFREAIVLWRRSRSGKRNALGFALANLAGVLTERGETADALVAAREGLPMLRDIGNAWLFLDHLALRTALAGNLLDAAKLAGHADAMISVKKSEREPNEARAHGRLHAILKERLPLAELEQALFVGSRMSEDEAYRLALDT